MKKKIMVVDDSAFMRKIISDYIESIDGFEVIGKARDGVDALALVERIKPDLITLDIEMPRMNGLETLKRIKEKYDIPVIMLSSLSGVEETMEALAVGAEDFIEKPKDINGNNNMFKRELELKLRVIGNKIERPGKEKKEVKYRKDNKLLRSCTDKCVDAVVIGASTGGPRALGYLISSLSKDVIVPILIVQHMPKNFTKSFASRLDEDSNLKVVEAEDNMKIEKGYIYIAPGDYHMYVEDGRIVLDGSTAKTLGVRPAADYLFKTASQYYKDRLLGVVLTGMGRDGTLGMEYIKNNGGYNIVQDKETSTIFGMPESAIASNVVHEVLSLEAISKKINEITR